MSAAPSPVLEESPRRGFARFPVNVALDVIALRSGVPDNLPGRCTDLSEGGVGGMVAGELAAGQQVAIELRLPNVGVPVRARAMVRYQGRLRCGFEFVGLSLEQREMIRYWAFRLAGQQLDAEPAQDESPQLRPPNLVAPPQSAPQIRVRKRRFNLLLFAMLLLAVIGWWQWQRSWHDLEVGAAISEEAPLRVTPEAMEMRIVSKLDPVYPEEAREAGKQGVAVLDVVISSDGTVKRLQPVSGDKLLVKSATEAVRSWKFEPYLSSGRAVPVETTIAVEFRL
ncbi:MAG: TonB family protein [Terriglobales bacterium]|jgi:TonB family protein